MLTAVRLSPVSMSARDNKKDVCMNYGSVSSFISVVCVPRIKCLKDTYH
ncbi:hypothetical protein LSH36_154g07064 [Paralvinella palmiformis]|uniref:Uncharacterized protein n=1 Tax=Paralvinella palmiformis TaxID=53620 RepID=A0AAD9N8W8_9ANNE|nr:hypothetical protein LSH36_154g07064 [Paralvinella palmiformis]